MTGTRTLTDVPELRRFELTIDGVLAGFVTYTPHAGIISFDHTETLPGYEGRGVGGELARGVLDAARARQLKVWPRCPFIHAWIGKHPDYADLVDPAWNAEPGPTNQHD